MKQPLVRSEMIKEGVSKLEKVKELHELLEIDDDGEIAVYYNAKKVQYLRDLSNTKIDQDAALADLKKKLSSLSKLEIVQKVPKQDRIIGKPLLAKVTEMMSREGQQSQQELFIPDHFLCPISGDLMTDPVLIQSGQTYERVIIEKHFEAQGERAA